MTNHIIGYIYWWNPLSKQTSWIQPTLFTTAPETATTATSDEDKPCNCCPKVKGTWPDESLLTPPAAPAPPHPHIDIVSITFTPFNHHSHTYHFVNVT